MSSLRLVIYLLIGVRVYGNSLDSLCFLILPYKDICLLFMENFLSGILGAEVLLVTHAKLLSR